MSEQRIPPVLIFGYGNPSRGDDALGPELLQRFEKRRSASPLYQQLELLTDFQLQIEHAMDLVGRELVLFADASVNADVPYTCSRIQPEQDVSFTTHALTPAAVLHVYEKLQQRSPPPCYLLAIRGYRFELGQPISREAEANLEQALAFVEEFLSQPREPAR